MFPGDLGSSAQKILCVIALQGPGFLVWAYGWPLLHMPINFLCSTFLFATYSAFCNLVSFIVICWQQIPLLLPAVISVMSDHSPCNSPYSVFVSRSVGRSPVGSRSQDWDVPGVSSWCWNCDFSDLPVLPVSKAVPGPLELPYGCLQFLSRDSLEFTSFIFGGLC